MIHLEETQSKHSTMRQQWLVTGVAGFIGSHVAKRLLTDGHEVFGIDNLNEYYDPQLKQDRLISLRDRSGFHFYKLDITENEAIQDLFLSNTFDGVIHLAAQAGVQYSSENPHSYIDTNVRGFLNILEGCRHCQIGHLVYASSSSVYGANTKVPQSTRHNVDHPVSLYAASKKANELMAHTYSHLYNIPTTGLRFFTVYGPWGRPDMALFKFTKSMIEGRPIDVFNNGKMRRDFTYIDDIVEGVVRVSKILPSLANTWSGAEPNPATSEVAPYRIFNIGSNRPVDLLEFVALIEEALGIQATINLLPMPPGDVLETHADVSDLANLIGFRPDTSLKDGVAKFVSWYREYYSV